MPDNTSDIVYFTLAKVGDVSSYLCMNKICIYSFEEPKAGLGEDNMYNVDNEIDYNKITKVVKLKGTYDYLQIFHNGE